MPPRKKLYRQPKVYRKFEVFTAVKILYCVSSGLWQHCINKIFLIQTVCHNKPTLQQTTVVLMCKGESNSHSHTTQCCTLSFKCNMQYFTNIKTETATQNCNSEVVLSIVCSQLISVIVELQHTSLLKQT